MGLPGKFKPDKTTTLKCLGNVTTAKGSIGLYYSEALKMQRTAFAA